MQPIGALMVEHRLIDRMVVLMNDHVSSIRSEGKGDPVFIDAAVDFLRTYADLAHHGKEEDIYFRELTAKKLTPELQEMMQELIKEHLYSRSMVKVLREANARYAAGDESALEEVLKAISELAGFYPVHIQKEDKRFFYPTQEYFDKQELAVMLSEFNEFDAALIHDRYRDVVEGYESG